MVTSTDRPTNRQGEYRAICLFRKLENRKEAEICNLSCWYILLEYYCCGQFLCNFFFWNIFCELRSRAFFSPEFLLKLLQIVVLALCLQIIATSRSFQIIILLKTLQVAVLDNFYFAHCCSWQNKILPTVTPTSGVYLIAPKPFLHLFLHYIWTQLKFYSVETAELERIQREGNNQGK